jgi:hypothetical protein
MNRPTKSLNLLACGVLALSSLLSKVEASLIEGGIAFTGAATPDNSNLTQASQITFGATTVDGDGWGSFENILDGTSVNMYSPLKINPVDLPNEALWTVGGFSLMLTSLTVDTAHSSANALLLSGIGTLSGNGFEDTPGDWQATITTAGSPATFSWSAISGPVESVPDNGETAILLGSGLIVMGVVGRLRYIRS